MKLPQVPVTENIVTTIIIGLESGIIIFINIPKSEQPSILAASRYDIGMLLKKFLNNSTLNALTPAINHIGAYEPTRFICSSGTSTNVIYSEGYNPQSK